MGDYFGQLKASKFCLAPYGHGWGIRTGLYMAQGELRRSARARGLLGAGVLRAGCAAAAGQQSRAAGTPSLGPRPSPAERALQLALTCARRACLLAAPAGCVPVVIQVRRGPILPPPLHLLPRPRAPQPCTRMRMRLRRPPPPAGAPQRPAPRLRPVSLPFLPAFHPRRTTFSSPTSRCCPTRSFPSGWPRATSQR